MDYQRKQRILEKLAEDSPYAQENVSTADQRRLFLQSAGSKPFKKRMTFRRMARKLREGKGAKLSFRDKKLLQPVNRPG